MRKTFPARRWLALFLTLAMCLSLAPTVFADNPKYTVTVTPDSLELTVGETGKSVTATVTDDSGQPVAGASVTWEADSVDVVSIGADGTVTGLKEGTAELTATYTDADGQDYKSANKCAVTVKAAAIAPTGLSVALSQKITLVAGGGQTLTATVTATPEGADLSGLTYDWTYNNGTVIGVTPLGDRAAITGKTAGTAKVTVTATCGTVSASAACDVTVVEKMEWVTLSTNNSITLEPGTSSQQITASTSPAGQSVTWHSTDESVATVSRGVIYARSPGEAKITATIGEGDNMATSRAITVEVSGVKLEYSSLSLQENQSKELPRASLYGAARGKSVSWQSMNTDIADYSGGYVTGRGPGRTTITAFVSGGVYEASFVVDVSADPASTINRTGQVLKITDTLTFKALESAFRQQADGKLSHVTGLRMDTSQGTLYYKYYSEAEPGQGVAQEGSYYIDPKTGQKDLKEITFVPKPTFTGGQVTIYYTAVSTTYQNYSCRILLTVEPKGSASNITLATGYNTPVKLSSQEFERICQELNGVSLSSVTFTQPSQRQGALYTNYVSEGNYGSVVSTTKQYSRKDVDDIWFVPAPGFTGPATVYYTARGAGSASAVYSGKLEINVREGTTANTNGPVYNSANGGPINFDDLDFEAYRSKILPGGRTLSYIQFNSLPGASQGILYYDYRSAYSTGSRVSAGTNYYYGTRAPRLDRITFVPAADFTGTVRVPFTGWDLDGSRFSGSVEINVRGGSGEADIRYTCTPGRTVSFVRSDFWNLCQELTGRNLDYIIFQSLPGSSNGTIYHSSNQSVTTARRYYYSDSESYRLSRLSFRASSGFFGSVDIPFVGYATNGDSFNGVITINSDGVSDWTIRYTTPNNGAAVFDRDDFDSLSQWETRNNVNSVRFEIPSTSQGDLYRNYYSTSSKGTRISSNGTSVSRSGLNQVAFVPNKNFTGTVYLDFTASSANGGTFDGTLEIVVERAEADATARYYTQSSPVSFDSADFRQSNRTLSSVKFASMPPASAGQLYYRYTSPLRQEDAADTKTVYRVSGSGNRLISDLTFVPRAGYTGTVILPYTGTNTNGTTFDGEVIITVSPTRSSAYFQDMGSYSDAQRAAVDFLRVNNITRGMSSTQYGPENSIRRGDFARMLYQAMELSPRYTSKTFKDVPDSAYYAEAVNTLRALGIVSGVGGGNFAPNKTLSRQDAVCMIQRAMNVLNLGGYDGNPNYLYVYSDGDRVAGYAQGAMAFAVQRGYLPTRNGRLDPYQPLSRVDMAEMLHRVLTY